MKKNIPSISDSELEVMKLIWKKNPITSDEIINSLSEKMNWNPQTIKTFITRLVKKKAISYNRLGRNYLYYPVITQKEYVKVENKSFLQKIYDGAVDRLVYNFIEQEDLSEEDIDKLQKMLDNKKKDSTKNK
ncbi:BlaI/MecI/CopY family transcriptional regulator [Vallitalea guaymasensis]|uniref:BlaI/MecI/CopY family transcriptional regulator n=1 Tax=Vallitalea guaymasensis TaxID=1185412 RepID=A0A8J8M7T7_9FIRM|nr:BlaI/MecI/CopY family transcriptional regulator [Vallitalea guaymasensis]QUH27951.1 BlaI/MecI/CopY family transcriptional regulator [Vallitalea guaymasensis]